MLYSADTTAWFQFSCSQNLSLRWLSTFSIATGGGSLLQAGAVESFNRTAATPALVTPTCEAEALTAHVQSLKGCAERRGLGRNVCACQKRPLERVRRLSIFSTTAGGLLLRPPSSKGCYFMAGSTYSRRSRHFLALGAELPEACTA